MILRFAYHTELPKESVKIPVEDLGKYVGKYVWVMWCVSDPLRYKAEVMGVKYEGRLFEGLGSQVEDFLWIPLPLFFDFQLKLS